MFLVPATQISPCVGSGRLSTVSNVVLQPLAACTTSAAWELQSWRWWYAGRDCHLTLSSCPSRVSLDSTVEPPFWQTGTSSWHLGEECWLDYRRNIVVRGRRNTSEDSQSKPAVDNLRLAHGRNFCEISSLDSGWIKLFLFFTCGHVVAPLTWPLGVELHWFFSQLEIKQEPTLNDSSRTDQRCSFYFFLIAVGGYPWTHSNPAQCEAVSALGCFTAANSLGAFTMLNPHGLCCYADVVKDFCPTWFFRFLGDTDCFCVIRFPMCFPGNHCWIEMLFFQNKMRCQSRSVGNQNVSHPWLCWTRKKGNRRIKQLISQKSLCYFTYR